jgi:hypothetical protein
MILKSFSSVFKRYVYFNDADGLFGAVGYVHNPEE